MSFIKIVKFDFVNILRNPMLIIVNTVVPISLMAVMGFVTRRDYGAENISSYDYYGVTMLILTALFIAMTATNTFMEEKVKAGNRRMIYAPVSKIEIYLSKLIATYLLGTITYTIILLGAQYIFDLRLGGRYIIYIILLINMVALFGCSFGTMFCCFFKSEEAANGIMQIFLMFFILFGGLFFSVNNLGKIVEKISYISPVNWVTQCAFKVIYDKDLSIFLPTIGVLLLASIICIIVCQITFKPEEYV